MPLGTPKALIKRHSKVPTCKALGHPYSLHKEGLSQEVPVLNTTRRSRKLWE
ncbi:uncharacterized protein G2W53_014163 [Senna tora]|uniref:Uncharacterized protein n=1 Tax=Senna tora TaxID=362788 RepID=A0A834WT12_9FABA|nr:uncharacterized protein G2W53_014163 [Senna tora]